MSKIDKELRDFDEHFANVFSEKKREEELENEMKEKLHVKIKVNFLENVKKEIRNRTTKKKRSYSAYCTCYQKYARSILISSICFYSFLAKKGKKKKKPKKKK